MKQLKCPLNGLRNISEFTYGGEFHVQPNANECSKDEWVEYVFFHDNHAGEVVEWWCHTASSYWFIARRNTITDTVIETMSVEEHIARADTSHAPDENASTKHAGDSP